MEKLLILMDELDEKLGNGKENKNVEEIVFEHIKRANNESEVKVDFPTGEENTY